MVIAAPNTLGELRKHYTSLQFSQFLQHLVVVGTVEGSLNSGPASEASNCRTGRAVGLLRSALKNLLH